MQREKLWTPEFLGMGGSNLFLFMSQYIMVAALPIFIMDTLGGGDMEAGLAMTAFQIGAVSCRPLAGRIIDAVNKQKLMRGATAAFFLVMFAFNWFHSEQAIYALRLLHGCIFALATTAAAAGGCVDSTMQTLRSGTGSVKGEGIGYFALSTNLAMVVGPLIGLLIIGNLGGTALFVFMTALAILTFLTANARRLPDEVIRPAKRPKKGFHLSDFIERRSLAPALPGGIVFCAYGGILTFLPLYAKSLGLQAETSLFFVVFAFVIILTRPVIGRLFDEKGPDWTVWPGFAFFAAGMAFFSQVTTLVGLLGAAARRLRRTVAGLPDARRPECPRIACRRRDSHVLLVARHQRRSRRRALKHRRRAVRLSLHVRRLLHGHHRRECRALLPLAPQQAA